MESMKLPNGTDMPMLGLGTWQSKPGEVGKAIKCAIDVGYRHFDCAFRYDNETEVGNALKETIGAGVVKREDLFIASKLWSTYHAKDDVEVGLRKSLKNLQLDYLDLYLIHLPIAFQRSEEFVPKDKEGNLIYEDIDIMETWKGMERCVDAGLVKEIGVSNFSEEQVQRVVNEGRIKPATNQIEIHPYFSNDKLVQFCQGLGVAITGYAPFATINRPWATADEPRPLKDQVITDLATKYGKTPAQVILRWCIQRKIMAIPKSVTPARIKENFQVFDFELSAEDMALIMSINKNWRYMGITYVQKNGKWVYRDAAAPNFPWPTDKILM